MGDAVRRLSDDLARDPNSLAFLPLAELLLERGDAEAAWVVARRGQARHAERGDVHALVARVAAVRGDWSEALAGWQRAVELAAGRAALRAAALQGLAFVCFRLGRRDEAEAHLDAALTAGADPAAVEAARQRVRSGADGRERRLRVDDLLGPDDRAALAVGGDGAVRAGECRAADGSDVSAQVARALAGVAASADGAMRHLALGRWARIVVEADEAFVALAPAAPDGVVLVATAPAVPRGRLQRLLERVAARLRGSEAAA